MIVTLKRISAEPGFVLHHYDWSESSLILDVFTRQYGRVALVAKGAKKPSSQFRSVLLPLQKLLLGFSGREEALTLRAAEWVGGHPMPTGRALLAGLYVNELLIKTLAREDACIPLFDAYCHCVQSLATYSDEVAESALRAFELLLLRYSGVLPQLELDTIRHESVVPDGLYRLHPDTGLTRVVSDASAGLLGVVCLELAQLLATDETIDYPALMHACSRALPELKMQLRGLLLHHAGIDQFRTSAIARQMALI